MLRLVPYETSRWCPFSVSERVILFCHHMKRKSNKKQQQKNYLSAICGWNIFLLYITKLNLSTNKNHGTDNKIKALELYFHYAPFKKKLDVWVYFLIFIIVFVIGNYICNPHDNNVGDNSINNNNNNSNNNSNNNCFPETWKYWVDVQWGIVSSHGERDPL